MHIYQCLQRERGGKDSWYTFTKAVKALTWLHQFLSYHLSNFQFRGVCGSDSWLRLYNNTPNLISMSLGDLP